jgi:hypothetical protein
MVTKPEPPGADHEALERALSCELALQQASDVPRRDGLTQIESMLRDRPRREVRKFAVYGFRCERCNYGPWQFPPCWISLDDTDPEHAPAVALLRRLIANNLSRYEPDPIAALAARPPPAERGATTWRCDIEESYRIAPTWPAGGKETAPHLEHVCC